MNLGLVNQLVGGWLVGWALFYWGRESQLGGQVAPTFPIDFTERVW